MKFYDSVGPNPRIVRMFMAEKGIEMPKQTVDLRIKDPNQLKLVKVGDQVEATYTEALAVSVEPAAKMKK